MRPRLFDFSTNINDYFQNVEVNGSTRKFPKFGKGEFIKITKPVEVKHNVQNDYTLFMEISQDDDLAYLVQPDMCILTTVKPETFYTQSSFQIFIVKNVQLADNKVQINADHIKYMFFNNVTVGDPYGEEETIEDNMQNVIDAILDVSNLFLPNLFTVTTDGDPDTIKTNIGTSRTLGDIFTNSTDGLLKQDGGKELKIDNFNIQVVSHLGTGLIKQTLRYGDNLTNCNLSISNEEEYTHIIPYARVATANKDIPHGTGYIPKYDGNISEVLLYANNSPLSTGSQSLFHKILMVDFSSKFKRKSGYVNPTAQSGITGYDVVQDALYDLGQDYITKHSKIKRPLISVSVSSDKMIKELNDLELGDKVRVVYDPLKYEKTHRVTEVNYNPVTNSYNSLTIGDRKFSLYDFISKMRW